MENFQVTYKLSLTHEKLNIFLSSTILNVLNSLSIFLTVVFKVYILLLLVAHNDYWLNFHKFLYNNINF